MRPFYSRAEDGRASNIPVLTKLQQWHHIPNEVMSHKTVAEHITMNQKRSTLLKG
jgi:hypothetical protein